MSYDVGDIRAIAKGRWVDILSALCGIHPAEFHSRHHACPACGGDDRFRFDDKDGDGTWFCNQCGGPSGSGGGGDGFLLVQRINNIGFSEAVNSVGKWLNAPDPRTMEPRKNRPIERVKIDNEAKWSAIVPMPEEFVCKLLEPSVSVWNPKKESDDGYTGSTLRPELATIVRDQNGNAVGAVLRCRMSNGVKWTPQVIYVTNKETGEAKLVMGAIPNPKPLVGSETIGAKTSVVIVEGEKTRDAAARLIPSWPCLSWVGGCSSFKVSDWSILAGKKAVIWPDADRQGWDAAQGIAKILAEIGSTVRIVRPSNDAKKGWDLADAEAEGWTTSNVMDFMKSAMEEPGAAWCDEDEQCKEPERKETPAQEQEEKKDIAKIEVAGQAVSTQCSSETEEKHYSRIMDMESYDWVETTGKKPKPKNTIENCEAMLAHYGIRARYNIIKKSVEVTIPGEEFTVDNAANATIAHLRSIACRNNFPVGELEGYVKAIAERNAYNPIANWIESKPWDGEDRLGALLETVQSPNQFLKETLITRWLISAVAAVYMNGFSSHGVLVFQGAQGVGKTTWIQRLMPQELSPQFIRTGMTLDPADKDHVVGAITNWIVELGELGSTFRKDVDRIKAFCTNSHDRVRRPYDRMESEYSRKTVFFASVNDHCFLKDETGNRRWWVVETTGIDYMHGIDTQQLWAQIREQLYLQGHAHYLSREEQEQLEDSNQSYMEHDPIIEIMDRLDWDSHQSTWKRMSATQILLDLGVKNPTRSQSTQVAKTLVKRGIKSHKAGGFRYFSVPPIRGIGIGKDEAPWLD